MHQPQRPLIIDLNAHLLTMSYSQLLKTAFKTSLVFCLIQVSPYTLADFQKPIINAESYLLFDYQSKSVIISSNPDKIIEPASMTKALTAYIVFDELKKGTLKLSDRVRISKEAYQTGGSRTFLDHNSRVSVEDLLKGVIIQSGNDASVALAEKIAGSEDAFALLMNDVAARIGMTNSHFVNATGWPAESHYTSPKDLATLADRLITDFPEYYVMFAERKFTYNNISQSNRNTLLWRDPSVDGIKTGHTSSAGFCLLSSAERNNRRLIAVITGAKSKRIRTLESQKLLNFGFLFFVTENVLPADEVQLNEHVWGSAKDNIDIGMLEDTFLTVHKNDKDKMQKSFTIKPNLEAPIMKGDELGSVKITVGDKILLEKPVFALQSVEEGSIFQKLYDYIIRFFNWIASFFSSI